MREQAHVEVYRWPDGYRSAYTRTCFTATMAVAQKVRIGKCMKSKQKCQPIGYGVRVSLPTRRMFPAYYINLNTLTHAHHSMLRLVFSANMLLTVIVRRRHGFENQAKLYVNNRNEHFSNDGDGCGVL